ncbi:MAG: glycosyltransferase, partial [Planctomycetaceae bacterium]|nr:glycosyltransferase [Planctomycetaceae bacterium]
IPVEVIVVEQSPRADFKTIVPAGVRYFHTSSPSPDMPFNRSWALNYGVRQARGDVVVLMDADMLLPQRFAASVSEVMSRGLDAVRPVRLLFYLDATTSEEVQQKQSLRTVRAVAEIAQNKPNPIAVRRDAYWAIGGHDESFWGWGGEDNEFVSRLQTLRLSSAGFLPVIHLWHASAVATGSGRNQELLKDRLAVPAIERIRSLSVTSLGQDRPASSWSTALNVVSSRTCHWCTPAWD